VPDHNVREIFLAQDDLAEVKKTSSRTSIANSALAKVVVVNITDRGGRIGERRKAGGKIPGFKYELVVFGHLVSFLTKM